MRMRDNNGDRETSLYLPEFGEFVFTGKDEALMKEDFERFSQSNDGYVYRIEPFYVAINTVDPSTSVVRDWKKEEGFSLWRIRGSGEKPVPLFSRNIPPKINLSPETLVQLRAILQKNKK